MWNHSWPWQIVRVKAWQVVMLKRLIKEEDVSWPNADLVKIFIKFKQKITVLFNLGAIGKDLNIVDQHITHQKKKTG
jgi:hypothetical protein